MEKTTVPNIWADFFIIIEFILCFLITCFTFTKNDRLVSLSFTLSFIVLFFFFLFTLVNHAIRKELDFNIILLIAIIIITFAVITASSPETSLTFEYFKKYIIFCSTVILLFIVSKVMINKRTVGFILLLNILLSFLYIYFYFSGESRNDTGTLTFNFTNPNLTAMWLLQTILYVFIAMLYFKNFIIRLLSLSVLGFLSSFLLKTHGRTSILALASFVFLVITILIKKIIKINRLTKINRFVVAILVLSPIIFAVIYLVLVNNGDISFMSFMESQGKPLDSREKIWLYAFSIIKAHPVLGGYYEISHGTGMSQMHNTHIDVWASYGTIVFVLLMVYMIRIVLKVYKQCVSTIQLISLGAFLAVIVMGIGEAALFSGGQGIYIFGCSFLLITRYIR